MAKRKISLTRASDIKVRPVHWLWDGRLPMGSLSLIAGREGIGKSTLAYQLAADVTMGRLAGRFQGTVRSVIVAATEDSWEHTIVPRLMAAGADLDRVYRVDVTTAEGLEGTLTLPADVSAMGEAIEEVGASMILLDPLMSRLDTSLDSHKDAEVRLALEPITKMADRFNVNVLGLIHVNKGHGGDPLTRIMGSRAFAAVARSVLYVMTDPDNEDVRLVGLPKNNLGKIDLPTLTFRIDSRHVADHEEGPVFSGQICWLGEINRSITEVLADSDEGPDARSATQEAGEWLTDFLTMRGGEADSAECKEFGKKAGHSQDALKRAKSRLKIEHRSEGFPRRTVWSLPSERAVGASHGESAPTALTAPTAPTKVPSQRSGRSGSVPQGQVRSLRPTDPFGDSPRSA